MSTTTEIDGIVAVVLVLAVLLSVWVWRRTRNRYGKLWASLAPLVHGSSRGARMTGAYQGLPIVARVVGDGAENPSYSYELTMTTPPSPQDWSLTFTGEKFLGTGTKMWRVKSKDDTLRQQLTEAGAATALSEWSGQPDITYKGKGGDLYYREPAAGMYAIPDPERFQAQLDLLATLAKINRQVNV